jgi:hypothetical protein
MFEKKDNFWWPFFGPIFYPIVVIVDNILYVG